MSAARRRELVRAARGIRPAEPAAQRFNGQTKSGVWDQVFASLKKHTSHQYLMPDTTLVQAQQRWATENEAAKLGVGVDPAADRPLAYMVADNLWRRLCTILIPGQAHDVLAAPALERDRIKLQHIRS